MSTTKTRSSFDHTQVLYQAAVDQEFRNELIAHPRTLGMNDDALQLPDAVEQQDQASQDLWNKALDAVDIYACVSTCTSGPLTIVCDGTTY